MHDIDCLTALWYNIHTYRKASDKQMEIVSLIMQAAVIILLLILIIKGIPGGSGLTDNDIKRLSAEVCEQIENEKHESREAMSEMKRELSGSMNDNMRFLSEQLISSQTHSSAEQSRHTAELFAAQKSQLTVIGSSQTDQIALMQKSTEKQLSDMDRSITNQLKQLETRFASIDSGLETRLQAIRETVDTQLRGIREDNTRQLEQIRGTVDEKLQQTLEAKMNESFRLVSERLEQVYKGLGEMQNVAKGVGDLKKVLSNVKTRGILGEVQLGAILKEILTPEQYDENVATVPKSSNRVEFAVKLPGIEEGQTVYLPIDSKFNGDTFSRLQDAYESADRELIAQCRKELADAVRKCAKDISSKYIAPPSTTQFAIMFLPVEGLYAEVVNMRGLVEDLQRTYKINVAGPSTMAAMLNSLRMGFQTLAVQKRSGEVWSVLADVKTEFAAFEKVLTDTQSRIRKAEEGLEALVGTRTRKINRTLSGIERLDAGNT